MADLQTVRADGMSGKEGDEKASVSTNNAPRPWPRYLVFFEQLEETIGEVLQGSKYIECWRGFNTHFHDDSRRNGDIIVWCLQEQHW